MPSFKMPQLWAFIVLAVLGLGYATAKPTFSNSPFNVSRSLQPRVSKACGQRTLVPQSEIVGAYDCSEDVKDFADGCCVMWSKIAQCKNNHDPQTLGELVNAVATQLPKDTNIPIFFGPFSKNGKWTASFAVGTTAIANRDQIWAHWLRGILDMQQRVGFTPLWMEFTVVDRNRDDLTDSLIAQCSPG